METPGRQRRRRVGLEETPGKVAKKRLESLEEQGTEEKGREDEPKVGTRS